MKKGMKKENEVFSDRQSGLRKIHEKAMDSDHKYDYKKLVRQKKPLVHCLTNHITILDCANMALAAGARPIMAEHPKEAAEITQTADALVCNLGNITDDRMQSILISGKTAMKLNIPIILDLVGVGCSSLRLAFAKECLENFFPTVIKGNISEIRAFAGKVSHAKGIDAGEQDLVTESTLGGTCRWLSDVSSGLGCNVVVTGKYDLITDGSSVYAVQNGCQDMGRITGTGCMLDVLLGAFAGAGRFEKQEHLTFILAYAAAMYGICGEEAMTGYGCGTGRIRLFDCVDEITDEKIREKMKVKLYESN